MAAVGLLIPFYRYRGLTFEPRRPERWLTRHSLKVVPRAKFYDEAGEPITLTGMTVRYTLKDVATQTLIVNRQTATLENQTTNPGEAYYPVTALQMANALDGVEEWEVDHGASGTETFPANGVAQVVRIVADVDNV